MVMLTSQFHLCTAAERPEIWEILKDPEHPLSTAWPDFLSNDPSQREYSDNFVDYVGLRKFQFAILETHAVSGRENVVACARSVPFFWPELKTAGETLDSDGHFQLFDSLPDGGYDTMVFRGIRQYLMREGLQHLSLPVFTEDQEREEAAEQCRTTHRPNALSALSITVRPERRRLGLAERLIEAIKQTAHEESLRALVTPLRPTRKKEFPWVKMDEYLKWTFLEVSSPGYSSMMPDILAMAAIPSRPLKSPAGFSPFDPWLRKHIQMDACIAKVAPCSMNVEGDFADWQAWTGVDLHDEIRQAAPEDWKTEGGTLRKYLEIAFTGGLVPLKVFPQERKGVYVEPNVWIFYKI